MPLLRFLYVGVFGMQAAAAAVLDAKAERDIESKEQDGKAFEQGVYFLFRSKSMCSSCPAYIEEWRMPWNGSE